MKIKNPGFPALLMVLLFLLAGCASGISGGEDSAFRIEESSAFEGGGSGSGSRGGTEPASPGDTARKEAEEAAGTTDSGPASAKKAPGLEARGDEAVSSRDLVFEGGGAEWAAEASPAPALMADGYGGRSLSGGAPVPSASGLKAGYSDDNRQYGYFVRFLEEYASRVNHYPLPVQERIRLTLKDRSGRSLAGARVVITAPGFREEGLTMPDGTFLFFPASGGPDRFDLTIDPGKAYGGAVKNLTLDRQGEREQDIIFDFDRILPDPIPLDLVFVMDTTGSMGDEIQRLKSTITLIHLNLTALSPRARVRFGMVLYKDVGDDYRTEIIPLTDNLDRFQRELNRVEASGGGDTPEDLQAALDDLLHRMDWNSDGIRLAYTITDAPPHLDYGQEFTYAEAAREAKSRGIKLFGIGTGGLDLQGEVVLRQMAQYTSGRYIFLTYGESGESEGGAPGSVSHHTGSNWSADKLENIIIRFTKEEVAHLSDSPLEEEVPWFEADRLDSETREETLALLFNQALGQLLDFSTLAMTREDVLAVLPFTGDPAPTAEYFTEHFTLTVAESDRVTLAERKDIGSILQEQAFQNSGLTEEEQVVRLGNLLNARFLASGALYRREGQYELFLKLIRTETGEILSVTRAVLDTGLGLDG